MVKLCQPFVLLHAAYLFLMIFEIAIGDNYLQLIYNEDQINGTENLSAVSWKIDTQLRKLLFNLRGFIALTLLML